MFYVEKNIVGDEDYMFYVGCNKSLHLTRGDTARITVDVFNDVTNERYEVKENDVVVLSVKKISI